MVKNLYIQELKELVSKRQTYIIAIIAMVFTFVNISAYVSSERTTISYIFTSVFTNEVYLWLIYVTPIVAILKDSILNTRYEVMSRTNKQDYLKSKLYTSVTTILVYTLMMIICALLVSFTKTKQLYIQEYDFPMDALLMLTLLVRYLCVAFISVGVLQLLQFTTLKKIKAISNFIPIIIFILTTLIQGIVFTLIGRYLLFIDFSPSILNSFTLESNTAMFVITSNAHLIFYMMVILTVVESREKRLEFWNEDH